MSPRIPAGKLLRIAALVAAVGCAASAANAQPFSPKQFVRTSGESWYGLNWWDGVLSPFVLYTPPTATEDAIVNGLASMPHWATIGTPSMVAHAKNLTIATFGKARVDHTAGELRVEETMLLGQDAGSVLGEYTISGSLSSLRAATIEVGRGGGAFFIVRDLAAVDTDSLKIATAPASFFATKRVTQEHFSSVDVHGDIEIGIGGPGEYQFNGGVCLTHGLYIASDGMTGTGSFTMTKPTPPPVTTPPTPATGSDPILIVRDIVDIGRGVVGDPVSGTLTNDGCIISGSTDAATIFVNGTSGRLLGTGTYDIKVTFLHTVDVMFPKNKLATSSVLGVSDGTPLLGAFAPRMLAGAKTIAWTATGVDTPAGIRTRAAGDDPSIEVPYTPASATGIGSIPAANIAGRVRLLQFGQFIDTPQVIPGSVTVGGKKAGQITNITKAGGVEADKIIGESPNLGQTYLVAAIGNAAKPEHQNPKIKAVHELAAPLTGKGVVMGQLEPGLPDVNFGCFENWAAASGLRATIVPNGGSTDWHTTLVASIMVGFDPLGVQVNGGGAFEPEANRYGGAATKGFGFTGVAPDATLISYNYSNAGGPAGTAMAAIAAQPGMKVVNISAGLTDGAGVPLPANGDHADELTIDQQTDVNGIIFVKSAGNNGTAGNGSISVPGGAYNAIVVGNAELDITPPMGGGPAVGPDYPRDFDVANARLRFSSSLGPTTDATGGRCKPDLVAQGTGVFGAFGYTQSVPLGSAPVFDPAYPQNMAHGLYSVRARTGDGTSIPTAGTSFAAPQVAGVAALMVQWARDHTNVPAEDPRVVKSILQSSADKRADWERGLTDMGADDSNGIPLSYDWGAGLMNPQRAVETLTSGAVTRDAGKIARDAWNLDTISGASMTDPTLGIGAGHSYHIWSLATGTEFTASLNWNRHVATVSPMATALADLDLEIYSWNEATMMATLLIAMSSYSAVDNLEHIYIKSLPTDDIILKVVGASYAAGLASEMYGISWHGTFVIPAPSAFGFLGIAGLIAFRRKRA